MIGSILIFLNIKDTNKLISRCLIFSSVIMLFISLTDLIPVSFNYIKSFYSYPMTLILIFFYIIIGFIIVELINNNSKSNNSLYKVGIISLFALIIHNIPEGIITFITTTKDINLGLHFAISIALHNIPEGISIAVPIYFSTKSKKKALVYTLIAAFQEPLGSIISYLFFPNINDYLFSIILSITAGIMIYLSIFDLLKESSRYTDIKDIFKNLILIVLSIIIIKIFI